MFQILLLLFVYIRRTVTRLNNTDLVVVDSFFLLITVFNFHFQCVTYVSCFYRFQNNYQYAWIKEDFSEEKISYLPTASVGSYLSVHVGQKVELIESKLNLPPEFCLVRLFDNPQQEGLIPINIVGYSIKSSAMSFKSSTESESKYFSDFYLLFKGGLGAASCLLYIFLALLSRRLIFFF